MPTWTRIRQRLLIEELLRKRRSDDAERFAEVFRRSTIDPNPHQIEAAMFALQRLPSGGAMLCDEVGLGKTIEAGLVITQLRSQAKTHILIIVPLALARQWQVELQDLFSLNSTIVGPETLADSSNSRGIFIIGRELASTQKGKTWLQKKGSWDLVIVDEAHEMFATIHTRFSKSNGEYQKILSKGSARRAAQVKALIEGSPVILLTATPLQNNLYELWGLIHYVDPEQRILGKFNEFCTLFVTGEGGRAVMPEMEETLRRRLSLVLKRTLRKQAQAFMKQPFRARHVHTANFNSEKLEAELHRAINDWLSREMLAAYRRGHRSLMALQVRRRMASSIEALVSTLSTIKDRMLKMRQTGKYPKRETLDSELDIENISDETSKDDDESVDLQLLQEDIDEIQRLEEMARKVALAGSDAKKIKLLEIIRQLQSRTLPDEEQQIASDKLVIFTESIKTMESLVQYLEANGFKDQVTTFSGSKEGRIAERALARWEHEVGQYQSQKLDQSAAIRGALIHEFKTQTKILIATEAGAKGLNLQFCNCLVNYDLPWNPQRIEQRIGRVHRYGQKHDVIIINFINLSNEAEARVYELLEQKLQVFSDTLGASDTIINKPEIALNLETRINEMLDRCRTPAQIQDEFDRFNLELDEAQRQARDAKLQSTRNLLQEMDSSVQARLGKLEGSMRSALSRSDEILLEILGADGTIEVVGSDPSEPARTIIRWNGALYHLGPPNPSGECGEPIHREHPMVQEAITKCVEEIDGGSFNLEPPSTQLDVYRVTLSGIEVEDRLLVVAPTAGSDPESASIPPTPTSAPESASIPQTPTAAPGSAGILPASTAANPGSAGILPTSTAANPGSAGILPASTAANPGSAGILPASTAANSGSAGILRASTAANPGSAGILPASTYSRQYLFKEIAVNIAPDLDTGVEQLKHQVESEQREYIDRLLAQITSRKSDLHLCGDASIKELQNKLESAERARRLAASPAASAKAQAQHKRLLGELDKLKLESAEEIKKAITELEEEEKRIRLMQFVDATPQKLFTVDSIASALKASS
ncbi:MAG: DEAD/DEAH box helicase family protein [Candidatus Obscuribacterales bacterium]|jgi:superfamily II DNA or RNA helicase|nr:DEAD/DEAH box helicase family protein [Candidatus Obscuribacterales bacterium]